MIRPMMPFHELLQLSMGADDALSRTPPPIHRARFIAATADLSASGNPPHAPINWLKLIIAPR